ncbi:MAG: hypothetical protein ACR2RF_25545 [Geminicoccaceae bacterium]
MAKAAPKDNEPDPTPPEPDPGILAKSPQDPPESAPELVAVKVGDQEVQVDKATAALIEAQNQQFQTQLDELRKAPPTAAPAPAPEPAAEPGETDWEKLMMDDPAGFANKIREDVTKELTSQYQATTAMRDFWGNFYDSNEDLKAHKTIVESVLNQNMGALGNLPATEASGKLADLTRETIVGLVKQFGPKDPKPPTPPRTAVEAGAGPAATPDASKPAEGEKVLTMTDALRERRKSRRKAGKSDTAA